VDQTRTTTNQTRPGLVWSARTSPERQNGTRGLGAAAGFGGGIFRLDQGPSQLLQLRFGHRARIERSPLGINGIA
jgi:hypothetical protein